MVGLLYEDEVFKIRGAIFEVHNHLGSGFLEAVYHECLERELTLSGIPFSSKQHLPLTYKGEPLAQTYQADLVCYDRIILELKACSRLTAVHQAQIMHYLKCTGLKLGLLVNFDTYPKTQIERIIL